MKERIIFVTAATSHERIRQVPLYNTNLLACKPNLEANGCPQIPCYAGHEVHS